MSGSYACAWKCVKLINEMAYKLSDVRKFPRKNKNPSDSISHLKLVQASRKLLILQDYTHFVTSWFFKKYFHSMMVCFFFFFYSYGVTEFQGCLGEYFDVSIIQFPQEKWCRINLVWYTSCGWQLKHILISMPVGRNG